MKHHVLFSPSPLLKKFRSKTHFGPTMQGPAEEKKAKGLIIDITTSLPLLCPFSFSFHPLSFERGIKVSRKTQL